MGVLKSGEDYLERILMLCEKQDLVRAMRSDLDAYKKHIAMVTALPEFKEIEELSVEETEEVEEWI